MRRDIQTCSALLAIAVAIGSAPRPASAGDLSLHSSADLGIGSVDEDGFALVLLEQGLSFRGFDLVLSGPLRFRIIDTDPQDDGALRGQDWDDPSDFARIAREVAFRKELDDGVVDVALGELNGVSVGHGAAVDHYFNSVDMDHYHGGVRLDVGYAGNGVEFVLNDVVAPELLVGRARVAPFAWFLDGDWPRRLELGFTLGSDIAAPRRVMSTADTAIVFGGGDVSLRVLDLAAASLTPYVDVMGMDGDAGVHAGLAATLTFSEQKGIVLRARGEYRRLGSDYHPALLNPFYERSRRFYSRDPAEGGVNTFADHLANPETRDPEANGWMARARTGRTGCCWRRRSPPTTASTSTPCTADAIRTERGPSSPRTRSSGSARAPASGSRSRRSPSSRGATGGSAATCRSPTRPRSAWGSTSVIESANGRRGARERCNAIVFF